MCWNPRFVYSPIAFSAIYSLSLSSIYEAASSQSVCSPNWCKVVTFSLLSRALFSQTECYVPLIELFLIRSDLSEFVFTLLITSARTLEIFSGLRDLMICLTHHDFKIIESEVKDLLSFDPKWLSDFMLLSAISPSLLDCYLIM